MTDAFFDTNILLYLIGDDPQKAARARTILSPGGVVSVQVLNEFVSVARRAHALDWPEIETWLDGFRRHLRVEPLTAATQLRAVTLARRHMLHIYDATILAAAEHAGCETVFSADMHDGLRIGSLILRNPFNPPGTP